MLSKLKVFSWRRSISAQTFLGMLFLSLICLILISCAIHSAYSRSMRENEIKYNILATDTIKANFDMTIQLITGTAEMLLSDRQLTDYVTGENRLLFIRKEIDHTVDNITTMQPFIEAIRILDSTGEIYPATDNYSGAQMPDNYLSLWQDLTRSKKMGGLWIASQINLSYVYPVYESGILQALIVMDISYDYLREMFMLSAIQLNEKVLVADKDGNTLFRYPHSTSFDPFLAAYPQILQGDTVKLEGKVYGVESVIYSEKLNLAEWRIIRIIQTDLITVQTRNVIRQLLNVGVILLLSSLFCSFWITRSLANPIKILNDACNEVEKGNMDVRIELKAENELGNLGRTINMMLDQVQAQMEDKVLEAQRKSEMQFEILQAQINPHFLYNTLDSIRWLAEFKNISSIAEMSTSLIHLLKYNLTSSTCTTTLREEVESVKNYITIQKFRYSDSFDFSTKIDNETLDCEVVRFILQPLVENCIMHGFGDLSERYCICVSAIFSDNKLCVKVIDNGAGITPEQMLELNDSQWKKHRFNKIGIANIRERIKLYFGNEYDVHYDSVPNIGTIAEITLPIIRSKGVPDLNTSGEES